MSVRVHAKLTLDESVVARVKAALRGAPAHVKEHRVSVGIHEQEASAQTVKVASGKPKTDKPKKNYRGNETTAVLIDVALFNEFGTDAIPDRSWLRSWFDQNVDRLKLEALEAMRAEYKRTEPAAVEALAARWYQELRDWIALAQAGLAPLKERTKRERQAAGLPPEPPLFATKQLVEAIRGMCDGRYA